MQGRWTENQQRAIDLRGCNILVSAAAGSGKTAVLVERVQNMLSSHELDISRLLITTFTNAAASEMRGRISQSLTKKLDENSKDTYLQRQLALFERANIGTIHSYCQNLLRNHFHEIGLSANFKIADDVDTTMLKQQALEIVLEEKYQQLDEGFLKLLDGYGGKKDDSLIGDIIIKIYEFARSTPDPKAWISMCKNNFINNCGDENSFLSSGWGGAYINALEVELAGAIEEYDSMISLAEIVEGYEKYIDFFIQEKEKLIDLEKHTRQPDWNTMYEGIQNITFDRLPRKAKEADETVGDLLKKKRNKIKDRFKDWKKVFYADASRICQELEQLAVPMCALCDLVDTFDDVFAGLKRENNLVDFSDLEQFTIQLLNKNHEIKENYDQILIDEYQDTNGAQAKIFERLGRGDNSFVVGDVKQSIYRFRNAQPQLFLEKAVAYENSDKGQSIYLANNFRSSKGIIDVANYIFEHIMSEKVGEVAYQDDEKLIFSGGGGGLNVPSVELHIIEKRLEQDAELTDEEWQLDAVTREAQLAARRIVQLVERDKPLIFDKKAGTNRAVTYGDITVLMRKTKTNANILAGELALLGVPVYCEDSDGYFASIEITTILSLLQVIDNPLQDIALVSVLRSPIMQFSDDELVQLRNKNKKKSFYELLQESGEEKCIMAAMRIGQYQKKASYMGLEELLRYILADTGYETFISAMPNSETRMMNLRLLYERAGKFERDGYKSVYDFIQYVTMMIKNGTSYTMAKVTSENENAVRIMSIHKSKGLEFSVVFLVNCGAKFNMRDTQERILYDLTLGIGADLIDAQRRVRYANISKQAIAVKKRFEMLSEEMRILYVALTRPINRLYIYGSVNDIAKAEERWDIAMSMDGVAAAYHVAQQNTLLDWICIGTKEMPRELGLTTEYHRAYEIIKDNRQDSVVSVEKEALEKEDVDLDMLSLIDERFSYVYPWQGNNIPSKLSVSEMIHRDDRKIKLSTPKFLKRTKEMSGAFRGTVIHFIMQNLNIHDTETVEQIKSQIDTMVERGMLSEQLAHTINEHALYAFFSTEVGRRLKNSAHVQREVKFLVEFKADEIINEDQVSSDEVILVQGVVDCYFEERDGIVILDYKTGTPQDNEREYSQQIKIYEKCLSKFLNKKIKESHLCYL